MEQDNLAKLYRGNSVTALGTNVVKPFLCPSDSSHSSGLPSAGSYTGYAGSSYAANYQMFGASYLSSGNVYYYNPKYLVGNIPDGTSNTVAMTEGSSTIRPYGATNSAWLYYASYTTNSATLRSEFPGEFTRRRRA